MVPGSLSDVPRDPQKELNILINRLIITKILSSALTLNSNSEQCLNAAPSVSMNSRYPDRYTGPVICSAISKLHQPVKQLSYSYNANMFTDYLNKYAIRYHLNQGITVCNVKDLEAGVALAKGILYDIVDKNSVLYLSGGQYATIV